MKKVLSILLSLVMVMTCIAACGKTKLPDLESVSRYSDEQLIELSKTVDEEALIKSWGEPQSINNERLWSVDLTGETKYVVAYVENGEVISLNISKLMYITVIEGENGVMYCLFDWNDYTTDISKLAFMPTQDRFGNDIIFEAGDQILFETDGMVAESYPAQLSAPYSYRIMGHLSDSEVADIVANIELY